ncbi:AAA family ATPase [Mesorhizobium sp. YC-39]|uniref:AAA family ATPase n=1 Tax=unclassified Mesorhizobium TaxID=325217 RepID=UPI0021E77871|nr:MULTISPECIES: AAA family ATPase [unclassified Mesorhizobium]MCV3211367.1 AAA family ATPase [Mesorhizobium sp. YC-2]MCV3233092.1 AAA family ATPase [Mesorhizobium sp. YC-39]
MAGAPIDDVMEWSQTLSSWKQDALRRLAISNELVDADIDALLAMVKSAAGFKLAAEPQPAMPFTKAHFGNGEHQPIVLTRIANVENVNRLVPKASLAFCPKALTIVYGRNGSGKSGFVRILRTACRTRVENPVKLKVLADVYGGTPGPQTAEIVVNAGDGEVVIPWSPGKAASPQLMQVAVFDTASAQLYVDGGNQIRFLPFGLALPHRLNAICITLKEKLEAERAVAVGNKVGLTSIVFAAQRNCKAQLFDKQLNKLTTDAQIESATSFSNADEQRIEELTAALSAGAAAAADVNALSKWTDALLLESEAVGSAFTDGALEKLRKLRSTAAAARQAATVAAGALFTDEPLLGVGGDAWRSLWAAARDYSVTEAYKEKTFPVLMADGGAAACVLCQQSLLPEGAARMQRFQKYMDDILDAAARKAEQAVEDALRGVHELICLRASDFADRIEQVRKRDEALADALANLQTSAVIRREEALAKQGGEENGMVPPLVVPIDDLKVFALRLKAEKDGLAQAGNSEERAKLVAEKAELEDRKLLAANKLLLTTRRNLLVVDDGYTKALANVQTRGITQRANELVDAHLTTAVVTRFDAERARFDIMHLNVGLARKSGQTKAEFEVDPRTKLTKVTSEILSEGEQRALALAGFLTEVALTDGSGPIVIDDPVSSLDRDRSAKVAERIAEEASRRQVVVFTHDIVFFNELSRAADEVGIEPVTVALFSDKSAAGKVDTAGMPWKGQNVAKRISRLKNDAAPLPKLHAASPAEYEYQVKNLYGRLRDTYERVVEEVIFRDIVRRGTDVIQTQLLRYVRFPDALAIRFHEGMTRANTHSHDNPAADTVAVPLPNEFTEHISELEALIVDLKAESEAAEADRPQMKPKK